MLIFYEFSLSFDDDKLKKTVLDYFYVALLECEEKLLELMREEAGRTIHGGAPGKPEWREKLAHDIHSVFRNVASDSIEFGVGVKYSGGTWEHIRAMLIAYGSGSAAGGAPIHAGPYGRSVWDSDLAGKRSSEVKKEHDLPVEFNQTGNDFVANALKRIKPFFDDVLEAAARDMPEHIFAGCVKVRG